MAKASTKITWKRIGPLWICEALGRRAYGCTKSQAVERVFGKIRRNRSPLEGQYIDTAELVGPCAHFPDLSAKERRRIEAEMHAVLQKKIRAAFGPLETARHHNPPESAFFYVDEALDGKIVRGKENRRLFGLGALLTSHRTRDELRRAIRRQSGAGDPDTTRGGPR